LEEIHAQRKHPPLRRRRSRGTDLGSAGAHAQGSRPNIPVIVGDDIVGLQKEDPTSAERMLRAHER